MITIYRCAEELGVTIRHLNPGRGRVATYLHRHRVILIRPGLDLAVQRSAVAHELGHAAHGDFAPYGQPFTSEQEHAADEWATSLLIRLGDANRALSLYQQDWKGMARELGVTAPMLGIWMAQHNGLLTAT